MEFDAKLLDYLSMDDLETCVGVQSDNRDELINTLTNMIQTSPAVWYSIVERIGLLPEEVEDTLDCTRAERYRWSKLGRLPILTWANINGRHVPLFDRRAVERINKRTLAQWRREDKQRMAEFKQTVQDWYNIDPVLGRAFEVALFGCIAAALAGQARDKGDDWRRGKWLSLKHDAIRALVGTPYASIVVADHAKYGRMCYVVISDDRVTDWRFVLSIPYDAGQDILPPLDTLPVTDDPPRAGMWRKGELCTRDIGVLFRVREVERRLRELVG
ncbi:MAG: hypothetical protein K6T83_05825 [Alicyclobacillus sp.]|nr:hypothetical protein [Alicyclobacillus sp.]